MRSLSKFSWMANALWLTAGVVCVQAAALPELHRIPLSVGYKPSGQVAGAFMSVRINRSEHAVRLLVDTGVSGIVLDRAGARRAGLDLNKSANGRISGFGGKTGRAVRTVVGRVEADGVLVGSVPVRVVDTERLLPDGDGLIGLDVFRDFLVEWNLPRAEILLTSRDQSSNADAGVPFRRVGHLMFVMTTCNNRNTGYGLVDTGAAFSAVATGAAGRVNGPADPESVPLRGVMGNIREAVRLSPVRFEMAGTGAKLVDREPLAMDLEVLSAANGLPVTAVIGYPALQNSTLAVDYRAGTIRISPGK